MWNFQSADELREIAEAIDTHHFTIHNETNFHPFPTLQPADKINPKDLRTDQTRDKERIERTIKKFIESQKLK